MQKLQITVVLGTARNERSSPKVSDAVMHLISTKETFNVAHVDVRGYAFTKTEPGWEESSIAEPWRKIVQSTDGFLFIIPEYNWSFPGEFKLLLDSASPENYTKRAAGLVTVSTGEYGGARVATSILPVFSELGLVHTNKPLFVQNVNELFDSSDEQIKQKKEVFERHLHS
jgi:NAD(P)H-dependent FMN reductase